MIVDRRNMKITLRDGRVLAYATYGPEDGNPVFYFHGGNSSRLEGQWFEDTALKQNVYLVAPDRPGFGFSDPQPKRTLLDWADDVGQLADALDIDRFAVLGLSGGGPHVAAVAYGMVERVSAAAIVSGVAPPEMPKKLQGMFFPLRLNFIMARYAPWLGKLFLSQMGGVYADPEKFLNMVKRGLPQPDRDLAVERPEVIFQFSEAAVESHRQGIEADAVEWQLYVRPWGFDLAEITTPVFLWYGTEDSFAPVYMGRYLLTQLPNSELREVADGGHFSTINNHIEEIFSDLLGMMADA